MKIAASVILSLQLTSVSSACSSSNFLTSRSKAFCNHALKIRGGQQDEDSDVTPSGSYHGNYIAPQGEQPKASTIVEVKSPPSTAAAATTSAAAPLASATSKSSKLANLQERTVPAILMLGATFLLLKYTGEKGLIGLILLMQLGLYSESTGVVESFQAKKGSSIDKIKSYTVQKWWWFLTAMLFSGRDLIMQNTSLTGDQMSIINFCMSAASLVGAVIQLAMLSGPGTEDLYREYLGKLACCHFSLLFLVGQSSFWIKTVQEYGLGWVLFPAFLVIVNDTMAYVFGVLMGKHKLIPKLSPKKTVEGFVGAGLSTVAIASPLVKRCIGGDIPNLGRHAIILAVYASLVSPFGGFLASAVKRAHGAKDFGALIPGHGGVVDRFDCQVVTAPFVYLYLKNFYNVES
ncbi:hypothetical protein ACHAWT_002790 [Skeletonema menzelii]|mmetsp:Transcript_14267/g.23409  ORF Transcript_14267/g.23409 Transcript_14267/m.23409 type:complete len:404 (+) Transcript_14267:57-1268(+)